LTAAAASDIINIDYARIYPRNSHNHLLSHLCTSDKGMGWQTAITAGDDWRQVARALLAQLSNPRDANIAFLYVTDELAQQVGKLFTLLHRATGIRHWTGGCNIAAFSGHESLCGEAGAVLMLGHVPEGSTTYPDIKNVKESLATFGFIHADPRVMELPRILAQLSELPIFWMGGLMINQGGHYIFHNVKMTRDAISLCCFDERVNIMTALFHGCRAFGAVHTVTSADGAMLHGLDHRPAIEIFAEDLTRMTVVEGQILNKGDEIHVALVKGGCDCGTYTVRGLNSIDPKDEFLNVAGMLEIGQKIRFVRRDRQFAHDEMKQKLAALKNRLQASGRRAVAAHYVSCMGRVPALFNEETGLETDYLRAAFGDIPIIGYYSVGEIMRGELHNFAGALTLFTEAA